MIVASHPFSVKGHNAEFVFEILNDGEFSLDTKSWLTYSPHIERSFDN